MQLVPQGHGRGYRVQGAMACPSDKSITHRSYLFAAMAKGQSRVRRPLWGADCCSTLSCVSALGVSYRREENGDVVINSPGVDEWSSPAQPLNFGNSGTTARLMTGLLAARPNLFCVGFGDASLSQRPMGRVVTPLRTAGASIAGRADGDLLPLAVSGRRMQAHQHRVGKASAQIKSALLFAGMSVEGETSVSLPSGSRDHTERMLTAMGADCRVTVSNGEETVSLRGPFLPPANETAIPGDPSSAAFFMVLAAMASEGSLTISDVLDNKTRTGFLDVLHAMGAKVSKTPSTLQGALEPVVDLSVEAGAPLKGVTISADQVPALIDEIPILAVLATAAKGETRFCDVGELRVKESDRLSMTIQLVQAAGGEARAEGDDLVVCGQQETYKAFSFDPADDHRMAMAAAILAQSCEGPCEVIDEGCVTVSFPDFFSILAEVVES